MQAVEAEGTVHEIGGTLARATDAAKLDDVLRQHAQFVHGGNDLVRDRVVAAALTQRGGVAALIVLGQADEI